MIVRAVVRPIEAWCEPFKLALAARAEELVGKEVVIELDPSDRMPCGGAGWRIVRDAYVTTDRYCEHFISIPHFAPEKRRRKKHE